jgi:hypothetical protein
MNKPLEELLPRLFSDEELAALKGDANFKIERYSFLKNIPGGNGLLSRIEKA